MGPPPMVTANRQMLRVSLTVACASACALGLAVVPAAPARAADTITAADQPYFSYYHLDQARAKGYTGAGVTIAMIDGPVETSAPELSGASIVDNSPCSIEKTPEATAHGTSTAALLVARDYGVVPDATLHAYRTDAGDAVLGYDCIGSDGVNLAGYPSLINHAINDGAQIITLSLSSSDHSDALRWAIARAMNQGVLITASAGNEAQDSNSSHFGWWSGVVGVSAVDTNGARASYSSWGQGVTTAAVGGPITIRQYPANTLAQSVGTSGRVQLSVYPSFCLKGLMHDE